MAISPHFHLHVINSSSAQRRVKQLHVGRPKHVTTQKKRYGGARERKRKETKFVDTRFCHAGAVCRPARAQRPELKLRNTDRLSQLLPYTHPPSLSSPPSISCHLFILFTFFYIVHLSRLAQNHHVVSLPRTVSLHLCPPPLQPPALSDHLYLQTDLCPFAAPGIFIHELIHKQHKHASGCIRMLLLLVQIILQMHSTPQRCKLILIGRDHHQIHQMQWNGPLNVYGHLTGKVM